MINEHDMTKKMMETVKSGKHLINEFKGAPNLDIDKKDTDDSETINSPDQSVDVAKNIIDTGDSDGVIQLTGDERKSEEDKFRDTIDNSARFDVFNIYPNVNNVVFGGKIQGMNGLEFQFTLEDTNGFYITGNNIQVTDDVARKITQMKGYYDNWRDEWFEKLATEYKSK